MIARRNMLHEKITAEEVVSKLDLRQLSTLSRGYEIYKRVNRESELADEIWGEHVDRTLSEDHLSLGLLKVIFKDEIQSRQVRVRDILHMANDIISKGKYGGLPMVQRVRTEIYKGLYPEAYASSKDTLPGRPLDEYRQSSEECARQLDSSYMHPDGP